MTEIQTELFEMQDLSYRDFHARLVPTLEKEKIIGVRIPDLRKYARKIKAEPCAAAFLSTLPHKYYEENNLHAFLIERISDFDACIAEINRFLPYVDNWATCDSMSPKCFKKNTARLLSEIEKWLASTHTYTIRFGIEMLMIYFLDGEFEPCFLEKVCAVKSDEYYVNMMRAWYFATALAKQYDEAVRYITENRLEIWTHNKTIQKAVESYRITKEQKMFLKSVKR